MQLRSKLCHATVAHKAFRELAFSSAGSLGGWFVASAQVPLECCLFVLGRIWMVVLTMNEVSTKYA